MKVLILTTSLGQGHNSAASSVSKQLTQMGHESLVVDMYEYVSPLLKEFMSRGYLFTVDSASRLRPIAKRMYRFNETLEKDSDEFSISSMINRLEASELRKLFDKIAPDAVICTQVYAAQAVNILKTDGLTKAFSVAIITDFTVQTYWQDTVSIDYIVTASHQLEYQLRQRGVPREKMLPFGIPIDSKFMDKLSADKARKHLELKAELPTILIMGGSMGYGKLDIAIKELDTLSFDFQAMVVCGNNTKMYTKLSRIKTAHHFKIYGYTREVDIMMDAADLIVTKPGGISTSEALAKGLPIVIFDPIPGMEERNAEFLTAAGAAILSTSTFTLPEAVTMVLKYPENKERMSAASFALSHPDSTEKLCRFVEREAGKTL